MLDLQLVPVENFARAIEAARGFAHALHKATSQCGPVAGNLVRLNRFAQVGRSTLVSVSLFPPYSSFVSELCAPLPPHVSRHPTFGRTRAGTSKF